MPETFVSDAPLVLASGLGKHCCDVIRRERDSKFLHRLLKFVLIDVAVAVFIKHLTTAC